MFEIRDFQRQSAFSSFLPGVAGETGIPIWCFYVNRGQGVCSFGTTDKEHPIMEFSPAHAAYQRVANEGFRTFVKANGEYLEPFRPTDGGCAMRIEMNTLALEQTKDGLRFEVSYFALPGERVGALMRELRVTNERAEPVALELLDGMPALLTYGTTSSIMKSMAQTHKAWMQVEDVESRLPYYRLRASSEDTTEVVEIKEGHFAFAFDEGGELLPVLVDPELVFDYNLSLDEATGFRARPLAELLAARQMTSNSVPTALFAAERTLKPGESVVIRSAYGMAGDKELLRSTAARLRKRGSFERGRAEAERLTRELTDMIATRSSDAVFDEYCRQSCLDNLLRGGYPITLGDKIFYVYSRKHGDIERDYNFFVMFPEYYSQGNANYRDINQNRRSDPLFAPRVGDYNIKMFFDLLQLDGYNPLSVERATFTLESGALDDILRSVRSGGEGVRAVLEKPYTPGALAMALDLADCAEPPREILERAIARSTSDLNAAFGEGYWIDHWTYNLDLIESYLAVFPEREETLLFDDESYHYYEPRAVVNPRSRRYTKTEKGARQYNALREREARFDRVRTNYGKGEEYRANLAQKLVVLALCKVAALDPLGMGLEMEAGKPGWYDALNGLPGLFGSSTAESCELVRLLDYMIAAFERYGRGVRLPVECADFMSALLKNIDELRRGKLSRFAYWDAANRAKEDYRRRVEDGLDGAEVSIGARALVEALKVWRDLVKDGVERSKEYGDLPVCYFTYELAEYDERDGEIVPKAFRETALPPFLEGIVRYMKMPGAELKPSDLYARVKESALYDRALSMYKVNAPLGESSYELGRCRAFTPGWLENESIWLHMEYKYLLELLRAGLYEDFFRDFHAAGVPILDPKTYGRSTCENSSFIASSANPNPAIHGKGFVARLSGSTAEFLQIWQIMMFGERPFLFEGGELVFRPSPALPDYLIADGSLDCTLLGEIPVRYAFSHAATVVPGKYSIKSVRIDWRDGSAETYGAEVRGEAAERIRALDAKAIEIEIDNSERENA